MARYLLYDQCRNQADKFAAPRVRGLPLAPVQLTGLVSAISRVLARHGSWRGRILILPAPP